MVDNGCMGDVKSKSTVHNGQSYKVRVMKTWRVITYNTQLTWKMTEQYLRDQAIKSTGHLLGIFTNTDLIRHDRVFNP